MHSRLLIVLLSALCLFSCGNPKVEEPVKDTVRPVRPDKPKLKDGLVQSIELIKGRKTPYEDAIGRMGDTLFYCSYKGKLEYSDTVKRERHPLFHLKAEFMVDKVLLSRIRDNTFLIAWQETDHEGVKSYVGVFEGGGEKLLWKRMFPVPNPGRTVIDGNFAYVTTLGMAGKISLADGSFAWKFDSLYNTASQPYQRFEAPLVFDDKVLFIDYPIPGRRNNRDTIKADPETGARLK